jgi:hypothetical protein
MRRFILAGLALVVFVVSVVVLHIASLFVVAAVLIGSGESGHTTVYLGLGFVIVTLVAAIAIAAGAVRYAAGRMTRR